MSLWTKPTASSQWGQDFRPSYLDIAEFLRRLPRRPVVGAFTATATEQVKRDIVRLLTLRDPVQVTTGFDRPNLYFEVRQPRQKLTCLLELLKSAGTSRASSTAPPPHGGRAL